jgi:hypothetical protein
MLKIRLNIFLYSFTLFLFLLVVPSLSHAAPKIVFKEEVHDLGDVVQGQIAEFIFAFDNAGTDELVIQKVTSS